MGRSGFPLRLQRKCQILGDSDAHALNYYLRKMRSFLTGDGAIGIVNSLNGKVRKAYQKRLEVAGGDVMVLCNKETMNQIEESLTSAALVNEMLGNRPFDVKANKNQAIINMLKAAARLKGATRQCPKRMAEKGFSGLVQKLSLNSIVLSAMGTMQGIDPKVLGRIKLISAQTARQAVWKSRCRIEVFQKQNKRMKALIQKLRQ